MGNCTKYGDTYRKIWRPRGPSLPSAIVMPVKVPAVKNDCLVKPRKTLNGKTRFAGQLGQLLVEFSILLTKLVHFGQQVLGYGPVCSHPTNGRKHLDRFPTIRARRKPANSSGVFQNFTKRPVATLFLNCSNFSLRTGSFSDFPRGISSGFS